jgi:hypothetical protein
MVILISTSKNALSFLLLLMSTLQKNWRKGKNRFCLKARGVKGRGEGMGGTIVQTMYAHMNK